MFRQTAQAGLVNTLMNEVRNKETNEEMHSKNIGNMTEFDPRTPGRKANAISTELKRTFPNAVVRSMGECNTILSAYTLYRHLG